jgi:hypothetical protein
MEKLPLLQETRDGGAAASGRGFTVTVAVATVALSIVGLTQSGFSMSSRASSELKELSSSDMWIVRPIACSVE